MESRRAIALRLKAEPILFRRRLSAFSNFVIWLGMCACAHVNGVGIGPGFVQEPAAQAKVVLIPNAVDFSTVIVGQKNTQTVKLSNTGTNNLRISNIQIVGQGLSIAGVAFPLSLSPQTSQIFNVEFAPEIAGTVNGTLTVMSNLPAPATVTITGIGTAALEKLQTDPVSINFGPLKVKGRATKNVTITNSGNSSLTVNQVVLSGSAFTLSELPSQFELAPQQQTSFVIAFSPQVKGVASGSVEFVTKQLSTPVVLPLAGDGVDSTSTPSAAAHTVKLEWDASLGSIEGYDVYRGEQSGGPYTKLTPSPIDKLEYSDTDVIPGHSYFYVVTSVNHGGHQSGYSSQISVTIPTP